MSDELPKGISITWLGHSTFLIKIDGRQVLIDPWLRNNPACPIGPSSVGDVDCILVTHGHFDHIADAVEIARQTGAVVIAPPAIASWLKSKGVHEILDLDRGGYLDVAGVRVHMTAASHSSEITDGDTLVPGGAAAGYVIETSMNFDLYYAGDTDVFLGMKLIAKLFRPQLAFLPIGGRYTMGPKGAAEAVRLLKVRKVIPMHWGTFDFLHGTPVELSREAADVEDLVVLDMTPGETLGTPPP